MDSTDSSGKELLAQKVSSHVAADGSEEYISGEDEDFDPSAPPPFRMADLRAAIPKHCWVRDPWRSLSYLLRDVIVVSALGAAAFYLDAWWVWPLYWPAQGTMFWALFVIGHDCGHASFSAIPLLNHVVGHFVHSFILVPYHGWRISHRKHHSNHGNIEEDETWVPLPEKQYRTLDLGTRILRFTVPFLIFSLPFYLFRRSPGKKGSHFNPNSELFQSGERKGVMLSTLCWCTMLALLVRACFAIGVSRVLKLYFVPYVIFVCWIDLVTYLQHHGYEQKLPWYRGKEWSYLRGGLTTLDRDYGIFNKIHHNVGTHVIHHLFPHIPHYHLLEATEAVRPLLGKYYREPMKSGLLPIHLLRTLVSSIRQDHFVSDTGDVVYYQTDPYQASFPFSHFKSN